MTNNQFHDLGINQDELTPPILIVDNTESESSTLVNDQALEGTQANETQTGDAIPQVSVQKRRPRDYARAYLTQSFSLQCNRSQILFERIYSRCDAHFTYLTVSIADRGMNKLANSLEEEIDRRFNTLEQLIETSICECDLLFDERNVPQSNRIAMSDKTRTYEVPLRTNFSARFLKLFTRFDALLCHIEALWINGVVRSSGRNQMISKWDRQMRDFSSSMRRLRDNTNNHIRAVYETKEQKASNETTTETQPSISSTDQNLTNQQPRSQEATKIEPSIQVEGDKSTRESVTQNDTPKN